MEPIILSTNGFCHVVSIIITLDALLEPIRSERLPDFAPAYTSTSPCRPIHGPEPADMKIVEFLCCGKRVKLSEHWYDVSECPFCRTGVVIT